MSHQPPPIDDGSRSPDGYRADLQGLRGVAILGVVAYHTGVGALSGGFVGVDIFFVLSGYLITGLLLKEAERTGHIQLKAFTARRIRRLLPASAFVLLVTLGISLILCSPLEMVNLARTAQAVSIYLSNMFFGLKATNYLRGDNAGNPFLQTWSLAVEEQFYLLWPLALSVLWWLTRRRFDARRVLGIVLACITALSFGMSVVLMARRQNWAFFATPPRIWEFAVGGLAAMVPARWLLSHRRTPVILGLSGLALLALPIASYGPSTRFPGIGAIPPVIGTIMVLVAGSSDLSSLPTRMLSHRALCWFGNYSYSWYLWHWPFLVFAGLLWPSLSVWMRLVVVTLALVPSIVSFHFVEQPIRFNQRLLNRPRMTILGGVVVTVVCLSFATFALRLTNVRLSSPNQQLFLAASKDTPKTFSPACSAGFLETKINDVCVSGDASATKAIVLFGDSHAGHWAPALNIIAQRNGYQLILLSKASCPYADVMPFNDKLLRRYSECSEWRKWALDAIFRIRPTYVVMSSSGRYVPGPGVENIFKLTSREWADGSVRTFEAFRKWKIPFYVITDVPNPEEDVPVCLSRYDAALFGAPSCRFDRERATATGVAAVEQRLVVNSGGKLLNLNTEICPKVECNPWRGGLVLYSDENHLTDTFARTLAGPLARVLNLR